MDDQMLLRYSRQILLPEIDIDGQNTLIESSVLLIGLGGLGSPIAMYLAAAGVGRLVLVDHDHVELSNLQRQIVHGTADLKRPKVESARDRIAALNPHTRVEPLARRLEDADFDQLLPGIDVVVDATDNFETRFLINRACARHRKPLVSGAAIRFEGQVTVFHPGTEGSPCYRCLFNDDQAGGQTCAQTGVVAPLLGIIGSVQAMETLKVLMGLGTDLTGRLLLLDALEMEWHTMKFRRDPRCPVCGPLVAAAPSAVAG
ncbi:MAG: ThiF family adenylyltransferase [Gammaproteobacteria bacterium]